MVHYVGKLRVGIGLVEVVAVGMVAFVVAVVVAGMPVADTFLAWVAHNLHRLHYMFCSNNLVVAFHPVDIFRTVALVLCMVALLDALVVASMAWMVVA